MTYPDLSTLNATTDVSNIFVYMNTITNGAFSPMLLIAFFLIIFVGGLFASMRFSGRPRPELWFAAAGFGTFGMAVILSLKNGLLNPAYLLITIAVAVVGVIWLLFPQE